ncbi:CRAL-TRIO domain-containing protein C34C12.6 [Aphelenchoides besseyi]|nr:CRAL-TRIO domain-containing protein C34C12.6 [Aphelenchoides besseyi]KAI6218459.1 CRAL-TRIO domain-containing protein C34C12.6 [Aphelenchoides besseyi]
MKPSRRLQLAIVLLVYFANVLAVEVPFGNQCFELTDHRGISNSEPIAELWNVNPFECLAYCVRSASKSGDGCASVVYHKRFFTCQLYNHDGIYNGSRLVFAAGHEHYKRVSFEGECADKQEPTRGYPQGQNRRPKALAQTSYPLDQTSNLTVLDEKSTGPIKVEPKPRVDGLLFSNPPASKTCPRGQKTNFFAISSYVILSTEPRAVVNGIDQEACLMYCEHNINAIGDRTPCIVAVYDKDEETCKLYDERIKELGVLTPLQFNSTKQTASEKFCIDGTQSHACVSGYVYMIHHKRKIIDSTISQLRSLDSATECFRSCHKSSQCQGLTFRNGRCLLNARPPTKNNLLDADASSIVIDSRCSKL